MTTECYHHICADRDRDVLVLRLATKEICQPEVAESIRRELVSAFQSEGLSRVIVDLGNVEFISSVGYAPLISLRREIIDAGGKLVLCGLSDFVREVFTTTCLLVDPQGKDSMFYGAGSLEQAHALVAETD